MERLLASGQRGPDAPGAVGPVPAGSRSELPALQGGAGRRARLTAAPEAVVQARGRALLGDGAQAVASTPRLPARRATSPRRRLAWRRTRSGHARSRRAGPAGAARARTGGSRGHEARSGDRPRDPRVAGPAIAADRGGRGHRLRDTSGEHGGGRLLRRVPLARGDRWGRGPSPGRDRRRRGQGDARGPADGHVPVESPHPRAGADPAGRARGAPEPLLLRAQLSSSFALFRPPQTGVFRGILVSQPGFCDPLGCSRELERRENSSFLGQSAIGRAEKCETRA